MMGKQVGLLFLALVAGNAWADTTRPVVLAFSPGASQSFVQWVLQARADFPELTVSPNGFSQSVQQASCKVMAERPLDPMDVLRSEKNSIECTFENIGGSSRQLKLSLAAEYLESFGRRFEDHVTFRGALAPRLFELFERNFLKAHEKFPLLFEILLCDPNGNSCVEMYSLDQSTLPDSVGALICSRDTELAPSAALARETRQDGEDENLKVMILRQLKSKERVPYGAHGGVRCTAIQSDRSIHFLAPIR